MGINHPVFGKDDAFDPIEATPQNESFSEQNFGSGKGIREFTADFQDRLRELLNLTLTKRPDSISFDYNEAFCLGPHVLADNSQGLFNRAWRARVDNTLKSVYITPASDDGLSWGLEQLLFSFTGVDLEEIDLAFDQNGNAIVCASRLNGGISEVWLYWFDPVPSSFVFVKIDNGRSPRILLDYPPDPSISDLLIFYMEDINGLVYRQQRDRYATLNATPVGVNVNRYCEEVAFSSDWRLLVFYVDHNTGNGKYTLGALVSTLYPVPVGPEKIDTQLSFINADNTKVVIVVAPDGSGDFLDDIEGIDSSFSFLSGSLVVPLISYVMFDIDGINTSLAFLSATLVVPLILYTMFDKDGADITYSFLSASNPVIVIFYTMFDKDGTDISYSFLSATLV